MAIVTRTEPGPSALTDVVKDPQDIIKAMSEANSGMADRLGKAILQLKASREQFLLYARLHREKETVEGNTKAETNETFAKQIEDLLNDIVTSA